MTLQLFTCRYARFQPTMGLPIRTTVGFPRFFGYELAGHALLVSPSPAILTLQNETVYRGAYRTHLADAGTTKIRDELAVISERHGEPRLVLLCFDDLSKPDGWCHRRMFAEWWTENTGDEVPELAEPPTPSLF